LSETPTPLVSATRPVRPDLADLLHRLRPGQRIRVTQRVRVGRQEWAATTTGVFRDVQYLATGVTTNRVPEDDIVVPTVHFTKDNGELSSITVDEHTRIEPTTG
jgi:hypothetical protein